MTDKTSLVNASGLYKAITAGNGVTLESSLGELIDNSIDAKASSINIVTKREGLYVQDNGNGVKPDDLKKINVLFESDKKDKDGTIGKWGIGFHAALSYLGETYAFISKGRNTIMKRNKLKEYDEDREDIDDLPKKFTSLIGEDLNRDDTYAAVTDCDCHIDNDNIKKSIGHTYSKFIEEHGTIRLNGDFIESNPFTYPKEEQSLNINFKVKTKNFDDEGTYYLLESKNTIEYPNVILYVKKTVTEKIAQTQAIKSIDKGYYEVYKSNNKKNKKKYDSLFSKLKDENQCAEIQFICKKKCSNTQGGTCIRLGYKMLPKREPITPHNMSIAYSSVYNSIKSVISLNPTNFKTYQNKAIQSGPLNERFTDEMLYGVYYWLYLEIANLEKKRLKKEDNEKKEKKSIKQVAELENKKQKKKKLKLKPNYRSLQPPCKEPNEITGPPKTKSNKVQKNDYTRCPTKDEHIERVKEYLKHIEEIDVEHFKGHYTTIHNDMGKICSENIQFHINNVLM